MGDNGGRITGENDSEGSESFRETWIGDEVDRSIDDSKSVS